MKGPASMKSTPYIRPDSLDFRDRMFQPTLVEVPSEIQLKDYKKFNVPILDQGKVWACTGFALATIAHYLLRRRKIHPDKSRVSPAMMFEMARRYDDYTGENYAGSSARGAMKGWFLHGVCTEQLWPSRRTQAGGCLTTERADDAASRVLGAYLRVNHKDLVAMHCALAEVGILYAVANVHDGWFDQDYLTWIDLPVTRWPRHVLRDGLIQQFKLDERGRPTNDYNKVKAPHAFAIVAYDEEGFWIQNSYGKRWGRAGFGYLRYDDWLKNGIDVWVARLGVPTRLASATSAAQITASVGASPQSQTIRQLRPHLVRIHSDGRLLSNDAYGTSIHDLDTIFQGRRHVSTSTRGSRGDKPPALGDFLTVTHRWKKKRLLLYAGGELFSLGAAVQRGVADYRASLLREEVYPLAFIWRTGFWDVIGRVLRRALDARRPDSAMNADTDFMLDRLDDALEPLAREEGGKMHWDEIKRTALRATRDPEGGVLQTLERIARLVHQQDSTVEVHVIAHGAGALLMAHAVQLLTSRGTIGSGPLKGCTGLDVPVHSCTLWAPACTTRTFQETYAPAVEKKRIRRFQLITLTDRAEQADNCAGIYDRSLLYLISQAFEDDVRVPGECAGTAILGMERFLPSYPDEAGTDSVGEDKLGGEDVANQDDYDQFLEQFADLMKRKRITWLRSPAPLIPVPGQWRAATAISMTTKARCWRRCG